MDKHWRSMLFLFQNNARLNGCLTTKYFDLDKRIVHIRKLQETAKPWSQSEKFMLNLALHLFNERNKVNLSGMDHLDHMNLDLAFQAMQIRFK
ncbi:hypothetical protein [Paenibacillus sp. SN-8-1]|uniref:hypothetical protein n=1 Tax=Paenibacillus sp. SN-8-1 TaxID=3435409 RepID=UPI003D9A1070